MIKLYKAYSDGTATFEVDGVDADVVMAFLHVPLRRDRTNAGMYVTIQPRDLTNESISGEIPEGRGDSGEYDLFACTECETLDGR